MIRKYLWTLNIVFLLGFSYIMADLINLFVGRRLDVPMSPPSLQSVSAPETRSGPSMELYTSIVDRNIFGVNPLAATAPLMQSAPAPVQLPPLRMKLAGTIVGEPEDSVAILEDPATHEQRLYRVQDMVDADSQLIEITRTEVTFLRGGQRETLGLDQDATTGAAVPQPMAGIPVPASAGSNWILDRREVQEALGNLPQLLTKARVIPNTTPDGRTDGFRVVSIAPASFYERIGLRNGDILQRINGVEVKDPETFMRVFSQLKDESNISLDLIRNTQKETFKYEVR